MVRWLGPDRDGLPDWRNVGEFVAKIFEIIRADARLQHFLDDGQEIRQRANRAQWWRIGAPNQPARAASTNAFSITFTERPR